MNAGTCRGCGAAVAVRGGRYRRCACGSAVQPLLDPPVRPRIAKYIPRPEHRSMGAEVRRMSLGECRAVGDTITGHAAVYDSPSMNIGWVEVLEPGCFDGPLAEGGNIVARFNHSDAYVLGSTDDGRLDVRTDDTGLAYSVRPGPRFGWLLDAVRDGEVTSSSFAFNILLGGADRWGLTDAGSLVREVADVGRLVDVAPVEVPAYPAADDVALRSLSGVQARRLLELKYRSA
jgi:HK97 family phage prohead protease